MIVMQSGKPVTLYPVPSIREYKFLQESAQISWLLASLNGKAKNFKMELFNDIHEGSVGC